MSLPVATDFNFLSPDFGVKARGEVLIQYRAVPVVGDASHSVPDEESGEPETDSHSQNRQNR